MVRLGLDSSLLRLTRRSDCANQPHEGVDLLRNSRPVRTEVLLKANSTKERDDEAGERIIIVTGSTRCSYRLPRQPKLPGYRSLTPALNTNRTTYTTVYLHLEHPSG